MGLEASWLYSTVKQKVLPAKALAAPPCEHLHEPQLLWRPLSLGRKNTEVSLGSHAQPQPQEKTNCQEKGLV